MDQIEQLRFLTEAQVREVAQTFGTPTFVYSEAKLREAAKKAMSFPNAFGLTARFAMKSCPSRAVLKIFESEGLHIDASSGYEAERAMLAGIAPSKILLTAQEYAHNIKDLISKGVQFNATSLSQLKAFGEMFPGGTLGLRFNPGLGSGGTKRTNVGGPASSFGIWHEDLEAAKDLVATNKLVVNRVHTHIGSGSDPAVWQHVSHMSVSLMNHFPNATVLNLGGGYKVGRMLDEKSTELSEVGKPVVEVFRQFAKDTGRELRLEIEPGTYLVANAGAIVSEISSVSSTGAEGYTFYVTNTGMTEVLRPSLYGAQHPLIVVPRNESSSTTHAQVIVCGHCCESGDILTPMNGDPEGLKPRTLRAGVVGDYLVVEGAGAYCSSMASKNYNSFPEAPEVMLLQSGELKLVRKRQTISQMLENEID